jgi:hypothetical protein
MDVQSLLFDREAGWTVSKAKAWAKSHGYRYGKVDVTDQYIRVRQFDPKGFKTKRTITFGRGIRAIVAREDRSTMISQEARRRTRRRPAKKRPTRRRRVRAASTTVAAPKRRKRKAAKRRVAKRRATKRRVRAAAPKVQAPKRRRRRTTRAKAWYGDSAGHRKAAKKGIARKKRRRSRRTREVTVNAPRRRTRRRSTVMEAPRRRSRRRTYARAARGGMGARVMQLSLAALAGGVGFMLADGLDRWLATYNPAGTERPTDKFTSDGAGTLANTLNVASPPNLMRIGAGLGAIVVPAMAAMYVKNPLMRSSAEGMVVGSAVSFVKMLLQGYVVPMLKPKDASTGALQGSIIARLYPAEVAAAINLEQGQTSASGVSFGALSGPSDVGPFALGAESPYPDSAQALRRQAGMAGPGSDYPTVQNVWGTGAQSTPGVPPGMADRYPTAAQALYREAGVVGQIMPDITAAIRRAAPGASPSAVKAAAQQAAKFAARQVTLKCTPLAGLGQGEEEAAVEAAVEAADAAATAVNAANAAANAAAAATNGNGRNGNGRNGNGNGNGWQPGPPPGVGPGPQATAPHSDDAACACLGDDNQFLGFIGDAEEETLFNV